MEVICFASPRDPQWGFLSNWSSLPVVLGELRFATSEHAYQYAKVWPHPDAALVLAAPAPAAATATPAGRD